MTPYELLAKGGIIAWILVGMSTVAVAIVAVKFCQFAAWRLRGAAHPGHPLRRLREAADHTHCACRETWRDALQATAAKQLARAETGLGALSAISQLSPLLGLLGTVAGMILAFAGLEHAGGRPDPAVLAGGIWAALLTTALGLGVAIPARAALYACDAEVNRLAADMNDVAARIALDAMEEKEAAT